MLSTLRKVQRAERESLIIPRSVQQAIPITKVYEDGIFRVGRSFSKTMRFTDINYRVASKDDQMTMFMKYCDLINAIDSEAITKITINNRRLNRKNFKERILLTGGDNRRLDVYCNEYNGMLMDKATKSANNMIQDKYITVSSAKKNIMEARTLFSRLTTDNSSYLSKLGSRTQELDATERLRIFHDFYRLGDEVNFQFDLNATMRKGHDFRDYICPDSMEINKNYLQIGDKYCRVFYMREYASFTRTA